MSDTREKQIVPTATEHCCRFPICHNIYFLLFAISFQVFAIYQLSLILIHIKYLPNINKRFAICHILFAIYQFTFFYFNSCQVFSIYQFTLVLFTITFNVFDKYQLTFCYLPYHIKYLPYWQNNIANTILHYKRWSQYCNKTWSQYCNKILSQYCNIKGSHNIAI